MKTLYLFAVMAIIGGLCYIAREPPKQPKPAVQQAIPCPVEIITETEYRRYQHR